MNRTIYWASKQLKKGKNVRRKQWLDSAFLYLNEFGFIKNAYNDCDDDDRDLCIEDIEATDWEIYDINNDVKENKGEVQGGKS